jgi:hypothetical protein
MFGDVIFSYTRKQAIDDGVLVDVTKTAIEAGFKLHTVVTEAIWNQYIEPPADTASQGQSIEGRLWDVLYLAAIKVRYSGSNGNQLFYDVGFIMDDLGTHEIVKFKFHIGTGDEGEPVITIMLPNED